MKLVLVESPGKTKKIESYLGPGWRVRATFGHIRDLPLNDFGIDLKSMVPKYQVTDSAKKRISSLKKEIQAASEVYIATDLDREGEAIAWHVITHFKLKQYKRIVFNEITKTAIERAIASPRALDYDMFYAQEARRLLDRIVGYTVSPALNKLQLGGKVSAGRVQSVALKLVIERQKEIDAHSATKYHQIIASFDNWTAQFDGSLNQPNGENNNPYYFTDTKNALLIHEQLSTQYPNMKVKDIEKVAGKKNPPPPFITSTLQQAASVQLKLSPEETMKIAQSLYEKGLITYMRTDSTFLSEEAVTAIRGWINQFEQAKNLQLLPDTPPKNKQSAAAQEAHEAIRPSNIEFLGSNDPALDLTDEEKSLYQMIWKRTVASQCKAAELDKTKVSLITRLKLNNAPLTFTASGQVYRNKAWLLISGEDKTIEADTERTSSTADVVLPPLEIGQVITPMKYELKDKKTKPPKRYTEASLVKALEAREIGRPATYASIIKTLTSRKYVQIKQRLFAPTELGFNLYDALLNSKFSFFNEGYTRIIESQLDEISTRQTEQKAFLFKEVNVLNNEMGHLGGIITQSAQKLQAEQKTDLNCPECQTNLLKKNGKFGLYYHCTKCPKNYSEKVLKKDMSTA
ncbi:type I DNA topoisomerase [Shewanella colwelliana]|uniref:type I DNA topoisomerase n=1 Tax=Shewanella colwelliana TaxID=23 RepID=UPI0022AE9EE6|nr:type I DNA topoisomerase [Shewanella colwelliana]MCZ4337805.1 type I DNA topoisomerase [Shewanella colwelliana]